MKKPYRPKSREEIARNMGAIRSTENKTEKALRSAIHRRGLRFHKYTKDLPGKPDFVFPAARVAVFVDGDYWHSRVLQERGERALVSSVRENHREYWVAKFKRNVERDRLSDDALRALGWRVVRIWESDAKKNLERAATEVVRVVRVAAKGREKGHRT
ncbi:MAG TPA: very short patch repair endonuclease [Gemmatimonadaceae bacterium]|nr:very short patch repair endonuclease [Gemmatimonadaceae bacterium]